MHVDDFIDNFDTGKQTPGEKYARWFFFLHRLAAVFQCDWREQIDQYKLFCTYKGERYQVVGASRLGDIWLTKDFSKDAHYTDRVNLEECNEWSKDA